MGTNPWRDDDWKNYSSRNITTASLREDLFSSSFTDYLNPRKITVRESRDVAGRPPAFPIIIGVDVTGSMGHLSEALVRNKCAEIVTQLYSNRMVSNPHILMAAVGDVSAGDQAPLQVSQFETDISIIQQLQMFYLEGGGGGNGSESYTLPWYFALRHTSVDITKNGGKGVIITMGDENPNDTLRRAEIQRVFGYDPERDYSSTELFQEVSKSWEIYHLMLTQGGSFSSRTRELWHLLIGERAISVRDYTSIDSSIITIIQSVGQKYNVNTEPESIIVD